MDETALIRAAQGGDLDAFNRLVLAYQDMLYNQAYRVIGEPGAAEDATQEAFISAYRKLHTYRGGSFKSCLDKLSTDFRMVVVLVDVQGLDYAEVAKVLEAPLGTVKSRLARARRRMQDCLREFRELLPSAFRLREEASA